MTFHQDILEVLASAMHDYAQAELLRVLGCTGVVAVLERADPDTYKRAVRISSAHYPCLNSQERFTVDQHADRLLTTLRALGVVE